MNRRGHLSNKIPNVKLRPVPSAPATRTRNARSPSPLTGMDAVIHRQELEGEEDEEVSTAALRNVERPWKGIVITFTGVEQKNHYAALAGELGAKVESALTVHVTHVVAGGFGSDKYHYAIEHRLPVLTPEWIDENHSRWLGGGEVEESVDSYRLLPFSGLTISISGIEQLDRRKQIISAVKGYGGVYCKNLDRSCTHLISAKPTAESKSSEKVQWAIKDLRDRDLQRRRGKKLEGHDIQICYEEWIWDCVAFIGRFKEDQYDARKPRQAGRVKAEDVINGNLTMDEEKVVETKQEAKEDEGPAVLRKRKREDIDSLVGDLISTTVAKVEASEGLGGPMPLKTQRGAASHELRKASLLHATRTASFGPSKSNGDPTPSMPATAPQPPTGEMLGKHSGASQIFSGLRISHLIDDAYDSLERALAAHGGTFVTEQQRLQGEHVDYVVVRLTSPNQPSPVEDVQAPTVVTECWVEGCCFQQSLLPIDSHLVFRPLEAPMPVAGASKFSIHLSGISTQSMTYLRRVIRVIGANQAISLNRQTTHLVSGRSDGPKVAKAKEWGIKVISEAWLLAIGKSGQLEPETDYPVDSTSTTTVTGEEDASKAKAPVSVSQNLSQARALKLTPTHVDGHVGRPSIISTNTSLKSHTDLDSGLDSRDHSANPLSPPRGESARKLNQASASASHETSRASVSEEDVSTKSVYPGNESLATSGRNREMTDVLRQLAEKGDTSTSRIKAPRRSKGLRARTSATVASRNTISISPEKRGSSPDEGLNGLVSAQPVYDESVRVSIADPAAERERKKMMDALRKTSLAAARSGR